MSPENVFYNVPIHYGIKYTPKTNGLEGGPLNSNMVLDEQHDTLGNRAGTIMQTVSLTFGSPFTRMELVQVSNWHMLFGIWSVGLLCPLTINSRHHLLFVGTSAGITFQISCDHRFLLALRWMDKVNLQNTSINSARTATNQRALQHASGMAVQCWNSPSCYKPLKKLPPSMKRRCVSLTRLLFYGTCAGIQTRPMMHKPSETVHHTESWATFTMAETCQKILKCTAGTHVFSMYRCPEWNHWNFCGKNGTR